ncbi:YciI family protein [Paraconexibacter antarcticus]|uniref:YciI family protein n=1 Tax=Paraconexibacter antarcticus TaxID=2949664 RepID=A0ABY5DY60_9ACTN|nr:YciI family protein [Paraconexibacter antarcticus]UTI66963.1 YciI family protein [Paraconexibacter antarcticus]
MEYALLLYGPTTGGPSPEEAAAEHPRWTAYTQELIDAGVHRGGQALQWLDTATTVRERGGERLLSDGPFAETKEALAGFYLIDVPDLDTAIEWAAKIPLVGRGSVEVRPIMNVGAAA